MSSETGPALQLEGIGKRYRLGSYAGNNVGYGTLREEIFKRFRRQERRPEAERELWALRNVSFSVQPGERVGVIGRNGAGKSTLLKLLSRVTAPTEGRAEIRGRTAALLEVGTGFHPELTGRDNIVLNAAILGMNRREIVSRTDEIVEFAGVERFLDTPVKRYSSGMYLRLAFAVAAHLDPDILLIDEVLAVGDAEFQKKCLGRMEEIGKTGRTVVFVSHSMPAVLRLCDRVVLFDRGGVIADGSPQQVVRTYLDSGLGSSAERTWARDAAPGDDLVRLRAVRVRSGGVVTEEIEIRSPVEIEVEYWQVRDGDDLQPTVNLHVTNDDGVLLFVTNDRTDHEWRRTSRREGLVRAVCRIPGNFLAEGRHLVLAAISSYNPTRVHALETDAVAFQVVDRSVGDGVRGDYANEWPGVVRPMLEWHVRQSVDPKLRG